MVNMPSHRQPSFTFTGSQLQTVVITTRVASSLSLLGVFVIITTFCLSPRFRNPMHRLIFINAFYNIFDSAATFASRAGPEAGDDSAFCQGQAFLNQMFPLADVIWSLVMAIDVYLIVFRRYDTQSLKRLEWKYIVAVTIGTFIPAFTFLFVRGRSGDRLYGDAAVWCAITPDESVLRLSSYYLPIWLSISVTLGLYSRIGLEIIKRRRALMSITNDSVQLDDTVLPLSPFPDTDQAIHSQDTKTELDLERPTTAPSTIWTSGGSSHTRTTPMSLPATPNSTAPICPNPQPILNMNSRHRMCLRRSSSLSFRQYIMMPLLFALTLFSVWVPSTVNRIISLVNPAFGSSSGSYQLLIVAGVTCSLRGFFNGVVFILVGRGSRKQRRGRTMST